MKRARYKGIPCYFDSVNHKIEFGNNFSALVILLIIFLDKWILIQDKSIIYVEE